MEDLEKKEPKSEKRDTASAVWECVTLVWLMVLSLFGMKMYSNLTEIQQRLNALNITQVQITKEPQNVIHLHDTGKRIEGYPEVSCGWFSFTAYANIEEARKNSVLLESVYAQAYFSFSSQIENESYSQASAILPTGEKYEISVEDGKAQVVIPLLEPGIYVLEVLIEGQEEPQYMAFQWKGKSKTEIIMLKGKLMCVPHGVSFLKTISKIFQNSPKVILPAVLL